MRVFLVDGTYELFRQFFGRPSHLIKGLQEVGAMRGALSSTLQLIEDGATHVGVATDHVIESFRNDLYAPYKTGEGIDPSLKSQFHPFEDGLRLMGVTCWPMVDVEADDALASAAALANTDDRVDQVVILTPDKDLAQCVIDSRVVQVDRRKNIVINREGVIEKYGVPPESIADYLALVGDAADGFPGIAGFGAKGAAAILREYGSIEKIPADASTWTAKVRGAATLGDTLAREMDSAMLFKELATLRLDPDLFRDVDELQWRGPLPGFADWCHEFDADRVLEWAERLWDDRQSAS